MTDFLDAPYHSFIDQANLVREWWPSDTQESFEKMIQNPDLKKYFQSHGWLEPGAITYRFNKHGFRGDNFDRKTPTLLTLGCSFTMGIGLPENQSWPWIVGKELNLKVANIAQGGWSADACFRMAEYWIPALKPKLVILLAPPPNRLEIQTDEPFLPIDNIIPGQPQWRNDRYIKYWFSVDENSRLNNLKNSLAIKAICTSLNIPFLSYKALDVFGNSKNIVGYARDCMHAGPEGHKQFTQRILNDQTKFRHSIS